MNTRLASRFFRAGIFSLAIYSLAACSIAPTHSALRNQSLPELIPVRTFFADIDYQGQYRISPDGEKLVWSGVVGASTALLWRDREGGPVSSVKFRKSAPWPTWTSDSRYLLYHADPSGRELHHVYVIDTQNPELPHRDLTPHDGAKAFIAHVPSKVSDTIFVGHNRRDSTVFDLYAVNVKTGEETLIHENENGVISTLLDDEGNIKARVRQSDFARYLQVPTKDGGWRAIKRADKFDTIHPLVISTDSTTLYLLSNVGRDKNALTAVNLDTFEETLIFEHDRADFGGVLFSLRTRRPLAGGAVPDYPEIKFFDKIFEERVSPLLGDGVAGLNVMSMDREERFATLSIWDHSGASYFLVDLETGARELLGESSSRKRAHLLVEQEPITVTARDGMQLYGYLAKPKLDTNVPLPTVLLVHGGPWARDWWGYNNRVQFYANRGYAVLQINYRGSRGYGRAYLHAAEGEFAGKMHTDLLDAVDWAVQSGTADPERVAIVGGSYGGYAALVGMTMTPGVFACGIDNVGVSDLTTLIENFPPYWKQSEHMWHRFVGDVNDPEQRKIM
ncbi:MAG: alpha/beta fold hydrolase, partial [Pseudomonadota bacterium]